MSTAHDPHVELQEAILQGARNRSRNADVDYQMAYAAGLATSVLADIFLAYPEIAAKAAPVFGLERVQ